MLDGQRILLIEPDDDRRGVLARRLRAQGCTLEETLDPAAGAEIALSAPPSAVVADLWMPSISGVQLCRLLRSEPATMDVPVILCGGEDAPQNRFWAERAGAAEYVVKGRTGDLVRALVRAIDSAPRGAEFFVQLNGGAVDVRDRIARHLDEALCESVIAAEIRSLGGAGDFERLFDRFAQFMSQVIPYRWLALSTVHPPRLAIHNHPKTAEACLAEARTALGDLEAASLSRVEDEDAVADQHPTTTVVQDVEFGNRTVARFALCTARSGDADAHALSRLIGRELGGAVQMAALIEESRRLAATDAVTGLANRRAFILAMGAEIARCNRHGGDLVAMLLDVDHFKRINDERGHAAGDRVLASIGEQLRQVLRASDHVARWGGEEFVVGLTGTDLAGARVAADRLRRAIADLAVAVEGGGPVRVTASIGVAAWRPGETLESVIARADVAMYASKAAGRNRVTIDARTDVPANAPPFDPVRGARTEAV